MAMAYEVGGFFYKNKKKTVVFCVIFLVHQKSVLTYCPCFRPLPVQCWTTAASCVFACIVKSKIFSAFSDIYNCVAFSFKATVSCWTTTINHFQTPLPIFVCLSIKERFCQSLLKSRIYWGKWEWATAHCITMI